MEKLDVDLNSLIIDRNDLRVTWHGQSAGSKTSSTKEETFAWIEEQRKLQATERNQRQSGEDELPE